MPICIFGINHKTAPLAIREKVAFTAQNIAAALENLQDQLLLDEVAIISTCNRTEIIFRRENDWQNDSLITNRVEELLNWFASSTEIDLPSLKKAAYHHTAEKAVYHLTRVACGLDSMVIGEPQILGQVKDAYSHATNAQTTGFYLNRLFQHTFSVAKQVRTETEIGASAVSIAYAAASLAKHIFADLTKINALFIGAGDTISLTARHLFQQGVKKIWVANRTLQRAASFVEEFSAKAYPLSALPDLVADADIIISSTGSSLPIIGKGLMEKAIKKRKHRSIFMLDLAVPRDVEAEVAELNDVYLYSIDDMQSIVQKNVKLRESAAQAADKIIQQQTQKHLNWLQSLSSVSLLKIYREQMEQIKQQELTRALGKLKNDGNIENIFNEFANRLTQKIMHSPSKAIRQAGENNQQQKMQLLAEIFDDRNQQESKQQESHKQNTSKKNLSKQPDKGQQ